MPTAYDISLGFHFNEIEYLKCTKMEKKLC